jgi:hypothetical protein
MSISVTLIGPTVLAALVSAMVIAPLTLPLFGVPVADTLTDRFVEPVPDAGLTCSHEAFDVAVHVTVPVPLCANRTICAAVCDCRVAPLFTAPNRSAVLSSVIVGAVTTVRIAELLVAVPALFVATTRYRRPFNALDTVTVNVAVSVPECGGVFVRSVHDVPPFVDTCHRSAGAGTPLALAPNVADCPAATL